MSVADQQFEINLKLVEGKRKQKQQSRREVIVKAGSRGNEDEKMGKTLKRNPIIGARSEFRVRRTGDG